MIDPHSVLKHELGAAPTLIDRLEHHHAADLLHHFHSALEAEAKQLHHAVDETINGLPRLFRGPARKIVFPGGK